MAAVADELWQVMFYWHELCWKTDKWMKAWGCEILEKSRDSPTKCVLWSIMWSAFQVHQVKMKGRNQ